MKQHLITPILMTVLTLGTVIPSIPVQDTQPIVEGETQIEFATFEPKEEVKVETKEIQPVPTPTPNATTKAETKSSADVQSTQQTTYKYYLDAPDINLHTPMEYVGKYLGQKTPDYIPAIAQNQNNPDGADHLFIYGHDNGIFSRLKELPKNLTLTINGKKHNYARRESAILTIEQARLMMNQFVNPKWNGYGHSLAMMTCAGTEQNGTMSHRLVLFYDLVD